ncbi:MAG: HAD family hydrolase [Planctomycetes bacterium]|nr:HAD family hydrolase [Planctomycetota bacterium]
MSLPLVSVGPLRVSRLIVGGNPVSGISHQTAARNVEMMDYFTAERIKQLWRACEATGINTAISRADAHIMRTLREYWNEGGKIQWIAQSAPEHASTRDNISRAVGAGAKAVFLHGGETENRFGKPTFNELNDLLKLIHDKGVPAGMAAHDPRVHREAEARGFESDFYMLAIYNCGSLHSGKGERFNDEDVPVALEAIPSIPKPCIAYKVLAAGRKHPRDVFPRLYARIKPTDAVLVGMFPKDNPRMVEENVRLALEAMQ